MSAATPRRASGVKAPLRVLFVCTANISRSPYAERRARQALAGWNVEFSSAGIPGVPGRAMDDAMADVLSERGGSAEGHVSRGVDSEMLREADVIVTFEFAQHMRLVDAHPDQAARILGFGQAAAAARKLSLSGEPPPSVDDVMALQRAVLGSVGPNSMSFDIEDPYGGGHRVAEECADAIDDSLNVILPWLAEADLPALTRPKQVGASGVSAKGRRRRWPWGG